MLCVKYAYSLMDRIMRPTTPHDGQPSARYPASLNPYYLDSEPEYSASSGEPEIPHILLKSQHPDRNWHKKDPVLRMFNYLELQDYGHAFGPFFTAKSSLDGDIHHVFRDLVEIPGLQPALLLGSKFLSEPKLLPFWHALIFGDCSLLQEETEVIGWPCHEIRLNPMPLSDVELEKTSAALIRIAKDVSITSHSHAFLENNWAFTKRLRRHITDTDPERNSGTSSYMNISPKTFELLHPDTDIPTDQRNRISFMLAVNLCHEFAHAVYMFREPLPLLEDGTTQPPGMSNEIEPFINNDRVPELGQAWESILFGGHFSSLGGREDCLYGLFLTKWPGSKTQHCENPITSLVAPVARINTSPLKWETHYVVPMSFVENVFNQTYWKDEVKKTGTDALRFRRKLGCRMRNCDWQDHGLGDGYDSDDSERGRHADLHGIVRPHQRELPSPTLSAQDERKDDGSSSESTASLGYPPGYTDDELEPDDEIDWDIFEPDSDDMPLGELDSFDVDPDVRAAASFVYDAIANNDPRATELAILLFRPPDL